MSSDRNSSNWDSAVQSDLDNLKSQWLADPCWDLEDTPGYEWARDGLLAFRLEHEAKAREADEKLEQIRARRQMAFGRTPVGIAGSALPVVVCRDGSVWQLEDIGRLMSSGEDEEVRSPGRWVQLPPIPGSISDLNHDFWRDGGEDSK